MASKSEDRPALISEAVLRMYIYSMPIAVEEMLPDTTTMYAQGYLLIVILRN